jgi:hypothetical protein
MSLAAQEWAYNSGVVSGARFVLVVLADHAGDQKGEDWTCYPGMTRLSEKTGLSVESVERHLKMLVKQGWISRKRRPGRTRDTGVYLYTLHRDRRRGLPVNLTDDRAAEPSVNLTVGGEGDHPSKFDQPSVNLTPTTRQNDSIPPDPPYTAEPPENPHLTRAGVGAGAGDGVFGQVLGEWVAAARTSRTDPEAAAERWAELVDGGVSDADLAAAARAALAEDLDFKRRGPPGLQRWLGEKKFVAWLGRGPAAVAERTRFADETVRCAIVGAKGEGWAASWLDPAGWDAGRREISPRTQTAVLTLRRDASGVLQRLGVKVVDLVRERAG